MGWIKDTAKAVKDDAALKDRVRQQLKDGQSASDHFAKQGKSPRGERLTDRKPK